MDEPEDCYAEWSQSVREREISYDIPYMQNLKRKYKWTYLQNRNGLTGLENELMVTREEGREKEIATEFEINMYTQLYLKWINNKDLLHSTGNSAQCYVAAWMGEKSGGEWARICLAESFWCSTETIIILLIGYIPM